eukprot:TRINITY_DN19506_c0_g1_i1.p1 TRINITY_DN19506_c0_g1~~TRINITY_DN19506_c0_g1_i1.p1  ORF type:complete len:155 (+),score=29.91 TRINITY_DN19506_c0_g1_i1:26-466(+)
MLDEIRRLNASLFPIQYTPRFYRDLSRAPQFTLIALARNTLIASLSAAPAPNARIYIYTLGVDPLFRRKKIGSMLLARLIQSAHEAANIETIFLHVQTNNDDAMAFYIANGFRLKETIERYYKRIEPASAYLLEYSLGADRHSIVQ